MAKTKSVSIVAGTNIATVEVALTDLELAMLRDFPLWDMLVKVRFEINPVPPRTMRYGGPGYNSV